MVPDCEFTNKIIGNSSLTIHRQKYVKKMFLYTRIKSNRKNFILMEWNLSISSSIIYFYIMIRNNKIKRKLNLEVWNTKVVFDMFRDSINNEQLEG